jgi:hypothetical protein
MLHSACNERFIHQINLRTLLSSVSDNGTYINSQKIGLDRGLQILDGDELGLIVPLDPILYPGI